MSVNADSDIHYFKNKADFNTFYEEFIGREWLRSKTMTENEFKEFASKHGEAIVKPLDDWEGNGIRMMVFPNSEGLNAAYETLKSENVLIEEVVVQHPEMVFDNKSVNTIRIYSVYDDTQRTAFLIKTVLRVGVGDSVVDNSHAGGCSYEVDVETGRIISMGWSHAMIGLIYHPGTEICMLGRKIPHWPEVKEMVKQAAEKLPSVKFIGWDVAVTEERPILIEGNHDSDLDLLEFVGHSGYLPVIRKHITF